MPAWSVNAAFENSTGDRRVRLCRFGGTSNDVVSVEVAPRGRRGYENMFVPVLAQMLSLPQVILTVWRNASDDAVRAIAPREVGDDMPTSLRRSSWKSNSVKTALLDLPHVTSVGSFPPQARFERGTLLFPFLLSVSIEAFTSCSWKESLNETHPRRIQLEAKVQCSPRNRLGMPTEHATTNNVIMYLPYIVSSFSLRWAHSLKDVFATPRILDSGWRHRPRFAAFMASYCLGRGHRVLRVLFAHLLSHEVDAVDWLGGCKPFGPAKGLLEKEPRYNSGKDGRDSFGFLDGAVDVYRSFRFVIAFENTMAPGYTTEKLMNAALAGAIPIFWGSLLPELGLNPRRLVHCNITSPKDWDVSSPLHPCQVEPMKGHCDLSPNSSVWPAARSLLLETGATECLDRIRWMIDHPAEVEAALREPIVLGRPPLWDLSEWSRSLRQVFAASEQGESLAHSGWMAEG
jgi:hypothetical protein